MEYTENEIFNIKYNEGKDCIELGKRTSFIQKHKLISGMIILTIMLIGVNVAMIYEFFSVLSTI